MLNVTAKVISVIKARAVLLRAKVVIIEGINSFDIILDNPTLIAGDLIVPFHFDPSPQNKVDRIELWIDGVLAETRVGNAETDFIASGLTGGKTIQIKAYKGLVLLQVSEALLLPNPIANDFEEVVWNDADTVVDMLSQASDPQGLNIELDNVGRPDYGTVEVDSTNIIKITKENPNDVIDTVVDYTIKNSIGNTDTGILTVAWQKIFVGISSPVNTQTFEFDEDLIITFGFTPTDQPYVDSIELIIDGSVVETRIGNSTADFTIAALSQGNHNIKIQALDSDGITIANSNVVVVEYLSASIFANGLLTAGGSNARGAFPELSSATKVTISGFVHIIDGIANGMSAEFSTGDFSSIFVIYAAGNGFNFEAGGTGSSTYNVRYDLSVRPDGVYALMLVVDTSKTGVDQTALYVDAVQVTLVQVDVSVQIVIDSSLHYLKISSYTLQSNLAIDVGYDAVLADAIAVKNNGKGAYYKDVVRTPTSYYEMDQTNPSSVLIDSVGSNDLTLNNYPAIAFVDFVNYTPTLPQLFLNDYPNLYGESWALHQLDTNFTGDVIEVRRDNGDFQRYAFDSGELPLGAIASFVGSGYGRITWYKGQANGLELIQTNAANQPWLFKNGILQTFNGKPSLKGEGGQYLNGGDILNVLNRPMVSIVVSNTDSGRNGLYSKGQPSSQVTNKYIWLTDYQDYDGGGNTSHNLNGSVISNLTAVGTERKVWKNNVGLSTKTISSYVGSLLGDFTIGSFLIPLGPQGIFNGFISDIHIYFEDKLADLTDMNDLINSRYGIY